MEIFMKEDVILEVRIGLELVIGPGTSWLLVDRQDDTIGGNHIMEGLREAFLTDQVCIVGADVERPKRRPDQRGPGRVSNLTGRPELNHALRATEQPINTATAAGKCFLAET
jgi:hypothetical protein